MCIYYKSRVVTMKLCDAACFTYIQRLFNCYLLHVSKGQGHDDNGLANVKLNICCSILLLRCETKNKITNTMAHVFGTGNIMTLYGY